MDTAKKLDYILNGKWSVLILDGRNEHGTHVLSSFPTAILLDDDDIAEQAETIFAEAEKLGFCAGDHVWTNWTFSKADVDEYGRIENPSYWHFESIDFGLSKQINDALRGDE